MNPNTQSAVDTLLQGGTLLYPTDTIWGIGCDAANAAAVEKIYAIKQRDHSKSMLLLVLPEWTTGAAAEASRLLHSADKPTTVILPLADLPAMPPVASNLPADDGTIGLRIPRHDFCQQLLRAFGRPIVSTSANFSGQPSPKSYDDIDPRLKELVDYSLPDLPEYRSGATTGSRIVKLQADGSIATLRG